MQCRVCASRQGFRNGQQPPRYLAWEKALVTAEMSRAEMSIAFANDSDCGRPLRCPEGRDVDTLIAHDHLVFNYMLARVSDAHGQRLGTIRQWWPDTSAERRPTFLGYVDGDEVVSLSIVLDGRNSVPIADRSGAIVAATDGLRVWAGGDEFGRFRRQTGLVAPTSLSWDFVDRNGVLCAEIWLAEPTPDDSYSGSDHWHVAFAPNTDELHRLIAAGAVYVIRRGLQTP
jgi:hypothetical protein